MPLSNDRNSKVLRDAGWHSRGYLPHFYGITIPQFVTVHLADAMPKPVINRWCHEMKKLKDEEKKILLQKRIEKYLDQGYGEAWLGKRPIANLVQNSLLKFDGGRYRLFAWVVMPNHIHTLMTRFEEYDLKGIWHSLKSYTAHEANKILRRSGQFWFEEYYDRYVRNEEHFRRTVEYIENNPVKAGLCKRPEDWLFSSARIRKARN